MTTITEPGLDVTLVIRTSGIDYVTCGNVLALSHPLRRRLGRAVCRTAVPLTALPVICPTCGARVA